MKNEKRTTIYDIASALHISVGTVHRALHNTGRISEETKQRVLDMARQMNYEQNQAAQALRRHPITIGVLLCCPVLPFLQEVRHGIEDAFAELSEQRVYPDLHVLHGSADQHSEEIHRIIEAFCLQKPAAAIFFLSKESAALEADFDALEAAGIPFATIVNDMPRSNRIFRLSADGYRAGCMAAEWMHLTCPSPRIALLTGCLSNEMHRETVTGFTEEAKSWGFSPAVIWEHRDDPLLLNRMLRELLSADPGYQGVYITSASSIFIYPCLKELPPASLPRILTTDLFPENRRLLDERLISATLFQDPRGQGYRTVRTLYDYLSGKPCEAHIRIPPQIVMRSNMCNYPA